MAGWLDAAAIVGAAVAAIVGAAVAAEAVSSSAEGAASVESDPRRGLASGRGMADPRAGDPEYAGSARIGHGVAYRPRGVPPGHASENEAP